MIRTSPFDDKTKEYDQWFEKYPWVYQAELQAVKALLPSTGSGIEIGVGTGRFASRLGITIGLEPSNSMRAYASTRGIKVLSGIAEKLPIRDAVFDFVLQVATLCFLTDPYGAFRESHRILKDNGNLIVAFIDRTSPVGQLYEAKKNNSNFYRDAIFYAADDVKHTMARAGFSRFVFRQTVLQGLDETTADEPILTGHGKGSFVVLRGEK
jgi:SAM-dependent methyltransferase